ncbi:MAG: GGDEF domain-containing protein [Selenomonadaceae bacterium]|nr:GGDEF domain-containing protein [Selenomonadaceae bacterium]
MRRGFYGEKNRRLAVSLRRDIYIFTVATLIISGVAMYFNQMEIYKRQCEENLQNVATYLENLISADGEDFLYFQNYYLAHYKEMNIPFDYDGNYLPAQEKFETMLAAEHPGRTLGKDLRYSDMSPELRMAHAVYTYEYWMNVFMKARDDFHLIYVYYLVPTAEPLHMTWMLDCLRDEKEIDGVKYIDLGTDVLEPLEEHEKMWEAWNTGVRPEGYDVYDNEYGKTYAYYTPLHINNHKTGVIGVEIEIANVDKAILANTLKQVAGMGIILMLCVLILLWVIHRTFIAKLCNLQLQVHAYAKAKDPNIAGEIEKNAQGSDEVAALSMQVAAMILELEDYMKNLVATTKELTTTKQEAKEMKAMAHRDSLTGIRNKTAYDKEVQRLEWEMADGKARFGIAMIDLNFLKRINDTYGHDRGNAAIIAVCNMVCDTFAHSPVFRIGGDEFAVILEYKDYEQIEQLTEAFNARLEELASEPNLEPWERISASLGYAVYDPTIDSSVDNVFKRADKAMYSRKKEMKAVRTV